MAYEKQVFTDGQVLNAAHLNNMEDGIVAAHDATAKNAESIEQLQSVGTAAVERITALEEAPAELPAVNEDDNEKFLRVENGAWTAVSVGNAEEARF